MTNPFLFACGVPRSGTTLLQRMLDHHPELAVANDSHFIPRALELTDKNLIGMAESGLPIPLTSELVDNVRGYHRFWRLGIDDDELKAALLNSMTYQELVAALYDALANRAAKPWAGEKTPDYVRRLPLLHGLFPNAKFIHLVRDGRDVALSLLQWATAKKGPGRIELWNENSIAVSALWWRWLVMESRSNRIPSDVSLELRYEDLVRDAESTMIRTCEFLGLEYSDQMMAYHFGKSKSGSNLSAKGAWLAPRTGLRDWKTDMKATDVELFELLASDALELFGYELRNQTSSRQTIEMAQAYREWWDLNFIFKQRNSKGTSESNNATLSTQPPVRSARMVPE